jgi:hypothetical protein
MDESATLKARIDRMRRLSGEDEGATAYYEAAALAQAVLHDTVGGNHPLMQMIQSALEKGDWSRAVAAARGVITLYDEGGLRSPRLVIAHEIEGEILDLAQSQVEAAERADESNRQVHLALAAFLAGASLEDALRRLCTARALNCHVQRTSIARLQAVLFQPSAIEAS